ncbi:TPA: DUF1196 domain-containing protein, partial [Vibrio cholerae]|nr:DUF1196 domain-containing protein [Vibrio cholerae]HAS3875798.1 DUF1196 domain-containing protein [Vibrio cholerae]HAS3901388.1 DUF1196 domain-containing protein [Vibrio cholerae]HAS5579704.1 DUF1196 domain-containing protein [Vibrio cholerae]HAY4071241.1 DUF1196 domain-containing protein [Vibrio cholerae]
LTVPLEAFVMCVFKPSNLVRNYY